MQKQKQNYRKVECTAEISEAFVETKARRPRTADNNMLREILNIIKIQSEQMFVSHWLCFFGSGGPEKSAQHFTLGCQFWKPILG